VDVDVLNKLEDLVVNANRVQVVTMPCEPSHVYYLREGTRLTRMEADSPVIGHVASTLETLADKAADVVKSEGFAESERSNAQVWVDRSGVVLLLDGERRDKVTFVKLANIADKSFTQKDFVFTLRTTFRDCLTLAGDLLPIVRKVKFNATQSGESEVKHGSSSIGKSLTAEITGTSALPEYVSIALPVFAQAGVRHVRSVVSCALEPDAATCTFRLVALPGQIEAAVGDGENQVRATLLGLLAERKAIGVSVFMGRP
jgi:hypothetical protein